MLPNRVYNGYAETSDSMPAKFKLRASKFFYKRNLIFHQGSQESVLFLFFIFFYFPDNGNFLLSKNDIQFSVNDKGGKLVKCKVIQCLMFSYMKKNDSDITTVFQTKKKNRVFTMSFVISSHCIRRYKAVSMTEIMRETCNAENFGEP